jgi:hypothetical protein
MAAPSVGLPDVPGALPGTSDALKSLGTEHGLLGGLLLIALTAIVVLVTLYLRQGTNGNAALAKLHEKYGEELDKCYVQHQTLQERRITEARDSVQALERSTAAFAELKRSVDLQAGSSTQHSDAVRQVRGAQEENRRYFEDRMNRMEKRQEEIGDTLRGILRTLRREE